MLTDGDGGSLIKIAKARGGMFCISVQNQVIVLKELVVKQSHASLDVTLVCGRQSSGDHVV